MLNIVGKLLRGQVKLAISSKADRLKTIRLTLGFGLSEGILLVKYA